MRRILHQDVADRFNLDAAETAFFERELMHIYTRTYDKRYPELRARQFIPVSTEAGSGATSVNYRQWDRVGKAKIIAQNAKDLPRVDVKGTEFIRPVRTAGISYGYTLQELRQAAMAGRSLNAMRAVAARRAIEEILDYVACFGDPDSGIVDGFLNNSNVPIAGSPGVFTGLTPDQIIAVVGAAFERIDDITLGTESPNTILLPTSTYRLLATTPRSSVSDTTILQFIKESFPDVTLIAPWYRLNSAAVDSGKRMVVYDRSPDKLSQEIASEFEQLPVQPEGLEFKIPCIATTAGTQLPYPKGIDFTDDI